MVRLAIMKPKADLLSTLNKAQKQAVTHADGPMLIVAGAGTGKTTVLINRLAWLIQEKDIHPDQILLTTFTEKGAAELEERADKILPYGYVNLWINTFHGFGERILRDHALDIGLTPAFKVLNTTEQWMFLYKNLDQFNFDYYKPLGDPTKFIHEIIKHFSRLKDEGVSPETYLKFKIKNSKDAADELDAQRISELAHGYEVYNRLMIEQSFLDFGDLIRYTLQLFRERPNVLQKYREQFKYIMVDEFQDTNTIQYELVKLLAAPHNNLVAVGDDDQSIYRFRGASLSNIMQFKDDFPTAAEVVLTENYRSGQVILDRAYEFISHNNPNRLETKLKLDKKLISKIPEKGEAVYFQFDTEFEETKTVADMIKKLHSEKKAESWADMAILVRANDTADKFVKELTRQNIPNHFVSLKGLYYKPIILDSLAYLKLLDDYHEASSLYRVMNFPCFLVEHSDLLILTKAARTKLWSLYESLNHTDLIKDLSEQGRINIKKLLSSIKKHTELTPKASPSKIYLEVVRDCLLQDLNEDKDQEIFSHLNQFYAKIKNFESSNEQSTLKDFLTLINLEMEAGETGGLRFSYDDADTVKVMTAHAAKGQEFGHVFIPNLVDRKFPVDNRSDKLPIPEALGGVKTQGKDAHIEEERRLFYVAMTRAKRGLYCSGARDYGGIRDKKPSKFVAETKLPLIASSAAVKSELERDLAAVETTPIRTQFAIPETFSFSQLTCYEACPLNYKFIYILKIPTEDNASAVFGRCIHNCLRQYFVPLLESAYQESLFKTTQPDKKLFELKHLLAHYARYWTDNGYESRQQADAYKKLGSDMLTNFHAALGDDRPAIIFLEKKFKLKLAAYTLGGTIDRVDDLKDGTVEIIDYKTGNPIDEKKLDYKKKRQLLLYQAAVEESLGKKVSKLSFYYMQNNQKISFTAKPEDIIKVKEEMIRLIERIKSGDFSLKKGGDCKYCQHGPVENN